MQLENRTRELPLRAWALTGARAGDNDQVIALAEALGIPFEIKQLEYGGLRLLGPRLLGKSLISLSRRSRREIMSEPPPDLTISTGHRSVPAVRYLQHRSAGRMRSIHVGFPRVSPRHFDLVIATTQYPIDDHPNLLRTPYALTRVAVRESDTADRETLDALPRPVTLLSVGGPNIYWKIDRGVLIETLRALLAAAESSGGSILVTSSPRTPASIRDEMGRMLKASKVPSILASPGRRPLYSSLLDAADEIFVTADSVAMVSDAIWTAKPVALVSVKTTVLGGLATTVSDLLRPAKRIYPQDLRWFWRALAKIGVTETLALPRTSTTEEMQRVLSRVESILDPTHEVVGE